MKETNDNNEIKLINENEINPNNPPLIQKYSSESDLNPQEEKEFKEKMKAKEIHKSYMYNMKDYIFFFSLMLSSSMNFSYIYFPFIIIGIVVYFLIGKNTKLNKSIKFYLELFSMIYAILILIFKIICLSLVSRDNTYIMEHKDIFLDFGICYLRQDHTSLYFIMTFLGEAIVVLFSLYSFITSRACSIFDVENDTSLMKSEFWTNRNLIMLNYFFILSFAVFNDSISTLIYMLIIQILFFLSSMILEKLLLERLSKVLFNILKYCILVQIIFINIFNVPRLQENVLHLKDITDKDGNLKVYSIFTQIGINYAYNNRLSYIWKEWIGYLAAIFSLISLTFSIHCLNLNQLQLLKKTSTISLDEAKNLLDEEENDEKNSDKKLIKIKKKVSKGFSCIKKMFSAIFKFITSSVVIMQFCRVMSIFYMYLYPNFYSFGIFIPLFFSSLFTELKMNRKLTIYLLAPALILTITFYHLSNVNGVFENFSDEKRRKYLNFALGKYEYSFLEYYGHNLFFIFVMFLIYSFNLSYQKEKPVERPRLTSNLNKFIKSDNDFQEPLLRATIEGDLISDNNNKNNIILEPAEEPEEDPFFEKKIEVDLNLLNLLLKFVFTHIDKITLIAMYFVSMRSINLIHLVLVMIFLIQILFPHHIQKMYKTIICILQILFLIELIIYLFKAYFIENFNKDFMNFITKYSDKVIDNDIELSIFLVLYCFYFQYQFDNFPYLIRIMQSRKIDLEKYVDKKFRKLPMTKLFLFSLGKIISDLYIWMLIGLFFVISCYYEINLIFCVKLGYFLLLSFFVLLKIQDERRGNKFSPLPHYLFLVFCSLNSLIVYIYQFKVDAFINSSFGGFSSENFFTKNLPNIGLSIYLKDNLYFNFLPHFGITFISVLFIAEIKRQLKNLVKRTLTKSKTMAILDKNKSEIDAKLNDKTLGDEDIYLLKAQKYEANEVVLKHLSIKYFVVNMMKIFTAFYWLFLFLIVGIIFSFYDLSFSMTIYIIIFSFVFLFMFLRRIVKLTAYINKSSYFVSKVIRYTIVEQPVSIQLKKYYRSVAFKYLLSYNFIFFIFLYFYGVFDLFQHGCNDSFFKGCEKSNEPIFSPDGTVENNIKAFAYLFGIYVDIRNEGLIKVAWVHILLSLLIGFDIYAQKLENKFTEKSKKIRLDMLTITNENNTLFRYDKMKDTNILIKIGLKLAKLESSKVMKQEIIANEEKFQKMNEEKRKKEEEEKKAKMKKEEKDIDTNIKKEEKLSEIDIKKKEADEKKQAEDEKIMEVNTDENLEENKFLEDKTVKRFRGIFIKSYDNDQSLSDSNNNSTKLIWFLKKIFEELIIVLLICIALTKLNLLSFIYFIFFAYLTITQKTMMKFYILYCLLLLLIIIQSIIYVTNLSEDTCPRPNSELLNILKNNLNIPWYQERINISKKYAFFFGFGVNKTQMGLLLLEYFQVIALYIYLEFFSFSIYQDVVNRGEKEPSTSKFNFGSLKLNDFVKRNINEMDDKLFNQYRECLKNFNLDVGRNIDEMKKCFNIIDEDEAKKGMPGPRFDPKDEELLKLVKGVIRYFNIRERMKKQGRDFVPDSDFIRKFQEFIYLYLHIFILFGIILISIMITGLISMFYLIICLYYLINSQKIYLGVKYGYPKQIKNVLKICLIVDIVIQLVFQIPYIPTDKDSLLYKFFNALGFSKLLEYTGDSEVGMASTGIIEIIGKPLIYLFISLQMIIYDSKDFKKYYIIFLLSIKMDMQRNGLVNAFIFNNLRINEFKNSVELRIESDEKMRKLKEKVDKWSDEFKNGVNNLEGEKAKKEDLKKKEEEKKKEDEVKKEKKEENIIVDKKEISDINKTDEIEEEKAPPSSVIANLNKFVKLQKEQKEQNEQKNVEKKSEGPRGLFGNLHRNLTLKNGPKGKEMKKFEINNDLLEKMKTQGALALTSKVYDANRTIIEPEKIKEKIRKILLSGKLTRFYLWFTMKSVYFKSMPFENKWNFQKDCFCGDTITKSYIENEIEEKLKILNLLDFDKREVEIVEDFFIKYKKGKLFKELEKIKKEIRQAKINKYNEMKNNNQIFGEINTNLNNNLINDDNNANDIDEKELEKIDVEYLIKKGTKQININTIKFKQFYYLLDTKLFKIYLQKGYLIKSILSNIEQFLGNNFDYLTYFIMIVNHMYNCSILSILFPISVFCYALLENPRPKKLYWQICLYYTIIILLLKFIFQLNFFNSIMDESTYSNFVQNLYNYKIGIKYFNEGFGSKFFAYIALDSLLLLILSLNKNVLISNGLWDRREEQIENIFLASERYEINKDRKKDTVGPTFWSYRKNKFFELKDDDEDEKIKKKMQKKKKAKIEQENEIEKKIIEIPKKENENKDNKKNKSNFGPPNEDIILFYEELCKNPKYNERNKKYFEKLFPKIRNEKPGSDKYPFMALSLAVIIVYILIFFTQMAQDTTYGPVDLDTTQFSGAMVLFLILHVVVLVYDRIIYISQNKSNLKYKYFLYKKDKDQKGIVASKQDYLEIKKNYSDKNKTFTFSPYLIWKLRNENFNLFYIQTEPFNCPLLQKYVLHIITTLICHIFAFFYFPIVGNYNLVNDYHCTEDDSKLCNDFKYNSYIIAFYVFYLLYLYISSAQIRLGYYDIKRKSLFKRNTSVTNLISKIFNAIPFLPQIRYAIDWTFTSTCFDLFQWIKFESIYDSIFDAYADADEDDSAPIGEKVERKKKISMGGLLSFGLVFILIIPLILFSSLNPTNKINNINAAKLKVDLTFFYENDVKLNYDLFENIRAKTIGDMFKNKSDSNWKKYKYDQSVQTRNFNHEQIQIITFSETSDRNWDLAEPHIHDLIELLNIENDNGLKSIKLIIHAEFDRDLPAEAQTVSHDFEVVIYNNSMDLNTSIGAQNIRDLQYALKNCSDITIELEEGYSSPLRITAKEEITEIEDEKYIQKKDIQLGFQGCEIETRIIRGQNRTSNTYLNSYFTFKSKSPNESDYSGAEFHAFNDVISEATSGYSVLTFYLTFILVAGSYVADFLASEPEKIMFTDLPHPGDIVDLCEAIKISRYSYDFKEEEHLYTILIELMRSPDYLKKLTKSSLETYELRKINCQDDDNEDEKDDDKKEEKDSDEEDESFYKDKDEIKRRIDADNERRNRMRGGQFQKKGPNKKPGDNDNIKKEDKKEEEKKEEENKEEKKEDKKEEDKKEEKKEPNEDKENNIDNEKEIKTGSQEKKQE